MVPHFVIWDIPHAMSILLRWYLIKADSLCSTFTYANLIFPLALRTQVLGRITEAETQRPATLTSGINSSTFSSSSWPSSWNVTQCKLGLNYYHDYRYMILNLSFQIVQKSRRGPRNENKAVEAQNNTTVNNKVNYCTDFFNRCNTVNEILSVTL